MRFTAIHYTLVIALTVTLTPTAHSMEFREDSETSGQLTLTDGDKKVFTYRFGDQLAPGVDAKYTRSSYIHPLYSVDGQILTDDFPKDHLHHHGVFWSWPIVKTRGVTTGNWAPSTPPLRTQFRRWIERTADDTSATLVVENDWILSNTETVARERVSLHANALKAGQRVFDISVRIEPIGGPLTLQGTPEGGKGYGGFSFRGSAALAKAKLLTDSGPRETDIVKEPHSWVDLSQDGHGVAIVALPDHPNFPPPWLARNSYAAYLNASWPCLDPVTLEPGKPINLNYKLIVHKGEFKPGDNL